MLECKTIQYCIVQQVRLAQERVDNRVVSALQKYSRIVSFEHYAVLRKQRASKYKPPDQQCRAPIARESKALSSLSISKGLLRSRCVKRGASSAAPDSTEGDESHLTTTHTIFERCALWINIAPSQKSHQHYEARRLFSCSRIRKCTRATSSASPTTPTIFPSSTHE